LPENGETEFTAGQTITESSNTQNQYEVITEESNLLQDEDENKENQEMPTIPEGNSEGNSSSSINPWILQTKKRRTLSSPTSPNVTPPKQPTANNIDEELFQFDEEWTGDSRNNTVQKYYATSDEEDDDDEFDDDTVASILIVTQKKRDKSHVPFERKAMNG
jgi:hypothetical protein